MKLTFSNEKNALIMSVDGEIDHRYSIQIRNEADRKIVTYPEKKFIIDLRGVTFMDSSAVGVIIGRYKLVKSFGGDIAIVGANSTVGRILEMSGIRKIIPLYQSMEEALEV
ncbi:MAG: anti-sigma factor antagonist [Clostridia bacterium]|nr:anti-sigma factor antagonist [Clostridia bacterium]